MVFNKMEENKIQELADDLWFEFADESDGWQTTMNYDSFIKAIHKALSIPTVVGGSFNLKIEDCWTACTRIKADKRHLLNKSTEWNNAYQEGFEECFKWLQTFH